MHFANSSTSQEGDSSSEDGLAGSGNGEEMSSPVLAGVVFTNEFSEGGNSFPNDIKVIKIANRIRVKQRR
jgi:hypothetical protein